MAPFFLDFEAFQHGEGRYQVKEMCMMDVDRPFAKPLYLLFAPSREWYQLDEKEQRSYKYVSNHLHKLGWYEGDVHYGRFFVLHMIKKTFPEFNKGITYVMGVQKMNFLMDEFPEMDFCEYHVSMKLLPRLPHNITCPYRNHGDHCACLKCYRLLEHYYELPQ
jgi:hypothetical protein